MPARRILPTSLAFLPAGRHGGRYFHALAEANPYDATLMRQYQDLARLAEEKALQ